MATTLDVTPQPATAGILVDVRVDPGTEMAGLVRSDANGAASVRLLEGQGIDSGALVVVDYEAALIGPVVYTFTDTAGNVTTASTTLEGLGRSYVTVPVLPGYSVPVELVTEYRDAATAQATVHRIIGRRDPVVTLGPVHLREGTVQFYADDYAAAAAIRDAYDRGVVVMLRQPDYAGLDLYHTSTRVAVEVASEPTTPRRWLVTVDFIGTARPAGPLLGTLGWSFDDVTATYPDFDTVRASFATFADLAVGPTA